MKSPSLYKGSTRPKSSPVVLQPSLLKVDVFHMDQELTESEQRALRSRLQKSKLQDRAQSARRESGTLKEYSRRRFQTVVDLETKSPSSSPPPPPSPPPVCTVPKLHLAARPKTTGAYSKQRPSESYPVTPNTPTNGPTKHGSILYNGKPFLLSSIRTRPKSEPPSRFDHLRGTYSNYPDIQRTLEQSNCEYRVSATPGSSCEPRTRQPPPVSPDFVMLIPVTSQASDVTPEDDDDEDDVSVNSLEWRQDQAWLVGEEPLMVSTERSRSPASQGSENAEEKCGNDGDIHTVCHDNESISNGCSPAGIPRLSLADTLPPPATSDPAAPVPSQSPETDEPRLGNKSPSLLSVPGPSSKKRPSSSRKRNGSRPSSARSDASSISSVFSMSQRPHCWVDDVTISSDESITERDLSLQNEPDERASVCSEDRASGKSPAPGLVPSQLQRGSSPSGERKKVVNISKRGNSPLVKRDLAGAGKTNKHAKLSNASGSRAGGVKTSVQPELPAVEEAVEKVEEGEPEIVLPRLLCPSSETKSRQAAIKEWLARSSFSTACRTVPLV